MHRPVVAALALALAACGVEVDDRPATLEYVTQAILVPYCANAQCHSSFRKAEFLTFATVDESRATINDNGLVAPGDPEGSLLYQVLISPGGEDNPPRMPYDQPMPDADVALIRRWIERGAPGL